MLPLCASLGITVNDLLSGERVSGTNYQKKAEENMMDLMKENEENRRRMILSVICAVITVIAVCALVTIASCLEMPAAARVALLLFAAAVAATGVGAAAVLGVSCDRPEEPQVKPTLTVSPSELAFAASGNSSKTVTVTAENVGWEITMSDESKAWITVTENSDGKTLTVSVSDNEAGTAPQRFVYPHARQC